MNKNDLNIEDYKSSEYFKYSSESFKYSFANNSEFKNNNSEFMFDFTSKGISSNRRIFDNLSSEYEFSNNNDEFKFNFNPQNSFTEKGFDFFIPPVYAHEYNYSLLNNEFNLKTDDNEKGTWDVLFSAIGGDISAKSEIRCRMPNLAAFYDALDPNLTRSTNDSSLMSEMKMYGRTAKNIRDSVVHLFTKPHEIIKDTYTLGSDLTDAGLHHTFGTDYHPGSQARNAERARILKDIWNSDSLTKREAILNLAANTMLFVGVAKTANYSSSGLNFEKIGASLGNIKKSASNGMFKLFDIKKSQVIFNKDYYTNYSESYPGDIIQHLSLKTKLRQNMDWKNPKPCEIKDKRLRKNIGKLYRDNATLGSGSTADAIRAEIFTKQSTKGKHHINKGKNMARYLENWLKNNHTANSKDRAIAENVLLDLKDSLGDKQWYSSTNVPH